MIKAAIRQQFQEVFRIVTVIAFGFRRYMKLRFTNSQDTVMTLTATTKDLLVICKRNNVEALRSMAGLAGIAGSDVIQRFSGNGGKVVVMTVNAIG